MPANSVRITDGSLDFSLGVDSGRPPTVQSAANPNGLPRNALAWLTNGTVRGGGITQRTAWQPIGTVHDGTALYQGGWMYEPDNANPYLVLSIGGHIYRVDVDTAFGVTDITTVAPANPANEPYAYFQQGEQFLIIQAGDNVTLPLFWDGTTMRRSNGLTGVPATSELPPAGPMDYYMGRLWYAVGRYYSAGDIVQGASGTAPYRLRDSILKVTENTLAIGGDGFIIPENSGNIRALKHTAEMDSVLGQGKFLIGSRKSIYRLQVPVTRADWIAANQNTIPLQTVSQIEQGFINDRSVVEVNGDLFYQSMDGIRSFNLSTRYFGQWGNVPLSNNLERLLQFNNRALMRFASGINFDNRLWQTVAPFQTSVGVAFRAVVPLDFDLISTLQTKLPPAWEGTYEGLSFLQLFKGDFGGRIRAFAVVQSQVDGSIQVWEMTTSDRFEDGDKRVTWQIEFPAFTWGKEFDLKKLDGGELWFDKLFGTVDFILEYRPDSDPCWHPWATWRECAARNSCEDTPFPVCYPYSTQTYREQYRATKSFQTPPADCSVGSIQRPTNIGYQFQCRLTIKGWGRVRGLLLHALPLERQPFANQVC